MDDETFNIYYAGEVLDGHDAASVREGLAVLFNANDATLDKLFSGATHLIRRNLDREQALRYKAAMERAGIGRGSEFTRDRSVRRDRIAWLNGETRAQQQLFDFLEQVRVEFLGQKKGRLRDLQQMIGNSLKVIKKHRYCHRLSMAGEPLHYYAVVGRKETDF